MDQRQFIDIDAQQCCASRLIGQQLFGSLKHTIGIIAAQVIAGMGGGKKSGGR